MTLESEIIRRFGGREVTTGDLVANFQLTPKAAKAVANVLSSERTRANAGAAWIYRIRETPPKRVPMNLSGKQKALFEALQDGGTKTRDELLTAVYGSPHGKSRTCLSRLLQRLRSELPGYDIQTRYGVGYRMVAR